ncbi:MAG: hypothetical protein M1814_002878 [Vezdaea aestivalis]|nr:MAG: hypothetical protein M1814_002878 [Vezdaea aestivalis]
MADEGATPRELLLECSRRNNTSLLNDVVKDISSSVPQGKGIAKVAETLNKAVDGIGNHLLHLAATYGSYEVLDVLLDQEGLEVDPLDRLEKDTPLHKAVRYANGLTVESREAGSQIVELLIDAGSDPRIRNKAKLKPVELVDPRNTSLRLVLQKAEYAATAGADVVVADDDDGPTGSASDSE